MPDPGMAPERTLQTDELLAHARWARRLAGHLVRDPEVADDLVQDTWLAALRHPPAASRPLRPWLRTVLQHLAWQRLRADGRRAARERQVQRERSGTAANAPASAASDELLEEMELQTALTREVLALPEPYRGVIVRRFYRGWSPARIAREAGIPAATVRSQLQRGLERLRARMQRHFGGDRTAYDRALLAFAGPQAFGWLGPAAAVLQGAWIVKDTVKLGWAVGALVALASTAALWNVVAGGDLAGDDAGARPADPVDLAGLPAEPEEAATPADPGGAADRRAPVLEAPEPEAPPAAAPPLVAFRGRVIDAAGMPLAGVAVGLPDWRSEDVALSPLDGRIEVALSEGQLATLENFLFVSKHRQWRTFVRLACPGHATRFVRAELALEAANELGDLVLEPGGAVRGRVVDAADAPLAGVRVVVTESTLRVPREVAERIGPGDDPYVPAAWTDGAGRFEVGGVPFASVRAWATAPEMRHAFSAALELGPGRAVADGVVLRIVPFDPEDRIRGRVVTPEGEPLARAHVAYVEHAAGYSTRILVADEDGRFTIVLGHREVQDIVASDPEGRWGEALAEDVPPGTGDLVLALRRHRYIEVRARDALDQQVGSFRVRSECDSISQLHLADSARAEGDGVARLVVPPIAFEVLIEAEGYASATRGPFDPASPPASIDFALSASAALAGRVTAEGEPVEGALVELREPVGERTEIVKRGFRLRLDPDPKVQATTDTDGRFRIAPGRGGEYVVLVRAAGFATAEWGPVEIGGGELAGLEIELDRGGSIAGRVTPPEGREARGQIVAVSRGDGDVFSTRTDEGGRYAFDTLAAGPWQVEHREREAADSVTYSSTRRRDPIEWDCEVAVGLVTRHDIDLRLESRSALHGRLAFAGEPAVGWSAQLKHAYAAERIDPALPVLLDADGRFTLEALAGPYRLELVSPGELAHRIEIEQRVVLGDAPLEVDLAFEAGGLRGTLPGPAGTYPSIHLTQAGASEVRIQITPAPGEDGSFEVFPAPVGRWVAHQLLDDDTGLRWQRVGAVEVRANELAEMRFE